MAKFDVLIRGGTVVDGTRVPRFVGAVGIKDGVVAQIGGKMDPADADQLLEADGMIVAPGFVDLHTHYDAQIQWDPYCTISGWHGVTSVVLGNCGFGFAPVRAEERDRAMLTMSRTEAIPFDSMKEGMLWDWISFPEWLDTLDRIPKGVNCLSYMPIAPLMIWVMGLKAAKSRRATDDEIAEMQRLLHEAMDAGACGWSTQRLGENSVQADYDGTPMVTDIMSDNECLALAEVLRDRDEGFIQITQATGDIKSDLAFEAKLAEVSGRPILHNVIAPSMQRPDAHTKSLKWLHECNDRGERIFGQAFTIRSAFAYTLEDWNLYDSSPAWNYATTGTIEEKMSKFADPDVRQRLKDEMDDAIEKLGQTQAIGGSIERVMIQHLEAKPELEEYVGLTLAQVGEKMGKHPIDAMLDLALATDLKAEFLTEVTNANEDHMAEIMESPYTIPGVSDGGAHTKFLTAGSYPTDFLMWMVRDTGKITLEEAHYRLSYLPARAGGFTNRGSLVEGAPADVVVYDLDELKLDPEFQGEIVFDFPGGEWRRVQKPHGYKWILVNGEVTMQDGKETGATPGKLLRHGRG
ncbi:MAG: amidohydrolase family protein [Chloroflexi bacterium]|nr:amidohydrolase family protein [Chloroflexota bacterium]